MDLIPTPSQTAGPFFHLGCTASHSVGCIAGPNAKGEHVRLTCRVLDGEGAPVDDAMIEIWQADAEGRYNVGEQIIPVDSGFGGFGRLATSTDGTCVFGTIKPGRVLDEEGKLQAPHLNVSVFARGVMKRLATRIYFAGDTANDQCPILALVPKERRHTLMAQRDSRNSDSGFAQDWLFDIHLCGQHETVFFDV